MEIGFNQETWQQPAGFAGSQSLHGEAMRPQWHGLHARLEAAYAGRLALTAGQFARLGKAEGSFDRGSARIVAGYVPPVGVNLTDLVIGKSADDICALVAGSKTAGDRG